jgi:membrane-bound serine protease (ClpP class)
MKTWIFLLALWASGLAPDSSAVAVNVAKENMERPGPAWESPKKVYVLPIREDIMPPLVYLVRRGVKEAMEAKADVLILDMDTHGGRVDVTEEVIQILNQFKGETVTYVDTKAFSAGAFIAVATQKIYMAPRSVIGAAAPIMLSPGGTGVENLPNTYETKMTSGISALIRTCAEKNGHNKEVVQAMIDKSKELVIDGQVLNAKGNILTLTDQEAEKKYGNPPKPLLSLGTVDSLNDLLDVLGYSGATRVDVKPLGAEKLASWINTISPLLLIIGIIGVYIEFKTPGFGLPGIVGIVAFAIYFLGGYVAGLAGLEWAAAFVLGLVLVALELFVFPGTMLLGLVGSLLMLVALVMGMVDFYPGMPSIPTLPQLRLPLQDLFIAIVGSGVVTFVLSRWLPRTALYGTLVSQTASGTQTVLQQEQRQASRVGQLGTALSVLRPGGKAQFGDEILDVITQGDLIEKGAPVRIVGRSSTESIVEAV